MKTIAYQFSEWNDLSRFQNLFPGEMLRMTKHEIIWGNDKNQVIYLFKYGVVCFLGYSDEEIGPLFNQILQCSPNPLPEKIGEVYQVLTGSPKIEVGYYKTLIPEIDFEIIKLIMMNLSQSVTLTYYKKQTEKLLEDIQQYTSKLEKFGDFKIRMKNLKKFIGKSLSINNRISENLYEFDTPPNAWNNEYLDKLDEDLKKVFKIKTRTHLIKQDVEIIRTNLELFTDIVFHRKGEMLEWIVIVLIIIEVVNTFVEKLFPVH